MVAKRWWALLLVPLLVGCASTRVVRLDTGEGRPLEYAPDGWDASVEVDEDDFEEALARLVLAVPLSIRPSQVGWLVRASSFGVHADRVWQQVLRKDYGRWCKAHEGNGDCLSLLEDGLGLDELDRLTLALGLAYGPMRESIADAVEDTLNPRFFYAVVVTGLATWVALLAAPEPLVTKAAAVLTAVMVAYLGVGPFLKLTLASFQLKQATDRATTMQELEEAGTRFGRVFGQQGARVFILALAAMMGQGTASAAGAASGLGSRVALLPGFAEASALGAAQAGLKLGAVAEVSAVAVSAGTLTVTLAPTAVAMVAMEAGGGGAIQGDPDGTVHHICTDKNTVSEAEGGPWTPLFEKIFSKARMSLKNDPANRIRIRGHQGPHPEAYHQTVFDRVNDATSRCRTEASCRQALTNELRNIAKELLTPGSKLRRLLTSE